MKKNRCPVKSHHEISYASEKNMTYGIIPNYTPHTPCVFFLIKPPSPHIIWEGGGFSFHRNKNWARRLRAKTKPYETLHYYKQNRPLSYYLLTLPILNAYCAFCYHYKLIVSKMITTMVGRPSINWI